MKNEPVEDQNLEIHETAFMTAIFRSRNEALSRDHFAKLWGNKRVEKWVNTYLKEVPSDEVSAHCLRNRYFLDKIKELIKEKDLEVVINFGCGFSMYPFLLDEKIINIEIDKPEIIRYKKSKINAWQNSAVLPPRTIHFIGVDFSKDYRERLLLEINSIKKDKACLVLIEGVLFFLSKDEIDKLFDFFSLLQKEGDFIGSASFQETIKETPVYKTLLNFIDGRVSKKDDSEYQTLEDEYYRERKDYNLIDHQDYFSLSKKYGNKTELGKEYILNENFYLLEKSKA